MEIRIKAYAYTIDIITEIRYFCKCNNAVFGKFRIIFTYTISKTDCSLHHNFHALFKISGNGKFVRIVVLTPHPSRNLRKSTPRPRTAPPRQPFQKPHYPSKIANTLASLVKGEVLSPERIRATTGGIATPLLPKPHYSLLCTNTLASLVKGRWIDGKAQTVVLLRFNCDTSAFFIHQTFCRQDGGIATPLSLACTNPIEPALSLALHQHPWLPCQRELDCDKAISYYKLQHSAISSTLIFAQPYLSQD